MSTPEFVVVLITTPDKKASEGLAKVLVETQSAACVSIIPHVDSIFRWQGSISEEGESVLIVKTRAAYFDEKIVPLVEEHHPYEVPEVIALPILKGSERYLAWIEEETA